MKKITLRAPIELTIGDDTITYRPREVYLVTDDVAAHPFVSLYLATCEDVPDDPQPVKKKRGRRKKNADGN